MCTFTSRLSMMIRCDVIQKNTLYDGRVSCIVFACFDKKLTKENMSLRKDTEIETWL